jgi:hypothetical protein
MNSTLTISSNHNLINKMLIINSRLTMIRSKSDPRISKPKIGREPIFRHGVFRNFQAPNGRSRP